MSIEILMPAVGAGVSHGKIIQWCKNVGEHVTAGDVLAEIETDKAVIELEAFDDGVLTQILVEAGDEEVPVGQAVAILSGAEQGAAEAEPAVNAPLAHCDATSSVAFAGEPHTAQQAQTTHPAQQVKTTSEPTLAELQTRPYFASPSARRLARTMDVDITQVQGTGPQGRIVRVDIERVAQQQRARVDTSSRAAGTLPVHPASQVVAASGRVGAGTQVVQGEATAHTNMRKTIARRLQEAKQTIPHFYLSIDCNMDKLMAMRQELNAKRTDVGKLSVNDILVFTVARAVERVPAINRQWAAEAMIQNSAVDVSVAVSTDTGLFTPVVRDAAHKSLSQIAADISALVQKARAGRLRPDEYEGGTLTVSNLGMFGIKEFSAIINPPQAAILAVGAVTPQPIVKDGVLAVANIMNITLSADHRVIDGAVGATFLAELRALVETPYLLLT